MVAGLILIGGKSTRMGTDKASLIWKGRPLVEHQINLLTPFCQEIYLSVNASQFSQYNEDHLCIKDKYAEIGPIGGISSALEETGKNLIILPIDMPLINNTELDNLLEKGPNSCFELNNQLEPFPSYWSFDLLAPLQEAIANKNYALVSFMKQQAFHQIRTDAVESFKNMNQPKDLK